MSGDVAGLAGEFTAMRRQRGGRNGDSGYPMLRLLALVSCGTRAVIDAVFRPISVGETTCAPLLLGRKQPPRSPGSAGCTMPPGCQAVHSARHAGANPFSNVTALSGRGRLLRARA